MNTPRFVGLLAFCLPGLLAVFPAVQGRRPTHSKPDPSASFSIWHKEVGGLRLSTDVPQVLQVQRALERAIVLQGPDLTAYQRARAALSRLPGATLSESSAVAPHYEWWWNPVTERWEIRCTSSQTFEIGFGRLGTVMVETRDGMTVE